MQISSASASLYLASPKAAALATSTANTGSSSASGDRTTLSDAAAKKLQAQKQALTQMKQLPQAMNDNAKANAQQRVSRLKKMMQQLRMMAGGNPKQLAKMVAQIAKELQAAVKEYVRASGGSQTGAGASAATATDTTGTDESSADGAASPDAAAATDSTATGASADGETSDASTGESDTQKTAADGTASNDAGKTGEDKAASDPKQQSQDDLTKPYETAQQKSDDKARDDFFKDVREIETKLKQALNEVRAAAKHQQKANANNKVNDNDIDAAQKALNDIDKTLSSPAGVAAAIPGAAVNISA